MSRMRHRVARLERDSAPQSEDRPIFHRCDREHCPPLPPACYSTTCAQCGHFKFTLRLDGPAQIRERIANVRRPQ